MKGNGLIDEVTRELMHKYLYCTNYQAGGLVPRPVNDTFHDTVVDEVVHYIRFHSGSSAAATGADIRDGFVYVLVIPPT